MINIAMFGGSFNPVHNGHIELLIKMISEFELHKVFVIPTNITPLKDNSVMVSADDRLAMCRLAFSGMDNIEVSDMEIKREGKSYTVDTLKKLKSDYPDSVLHLVVGADAFLQLPLWYKADEIFSLAKIITIARDKTNAKELNEAGNRYRKDFQADFGIIETPVVNISSTEVRNLIYSCKSVDKLIPPVVYDFIKENGFYGCKN